MFETSDQPYMPDLYTPELLLRRLTMADSQDIFDYSKDPEVARHVLWYAHRSLGESRAFLRYTLRQYRMGEPSSYGITLRKSGRVIGTIGFSNVNMEHRCAEIGYSLARAYWNRGLMTQALGAMLRYGFEQLGYYRIEAIYDVRNEASGRVMAKCGMRFEGTMRGKIYCKGEHITVNLYAITRDQYGSLT